MYSIRLKNNKEFKCDPDATIFKAAEASGNVLEHSCLASRCRSCIAKVLSGEVENVQDEYVLTEEEKNLGYTLTCNTVPKSDLILDIEDLSEYNIPRSKTFPAKIDSIEKYTEDILKIILRLPPRNDLKYLTGQYVNIIKGSIRRSYSIANKPDTESKLEFFIKKYSGGKMSQYWFNEAKINDLLRIEGPLGSFFLRNSEIENLVFLATGTGIAPVKSIIEDITTDTNIKDKKIFILWGGRYVEDFFWKPNVKFSNITFIPVLSRKDETWKGKRGYVQNILLEMNLNLASTEVYACGSNEMIKSSRKLLCDNGLNESQFFSDAFVSTN